MSTSVPIQREQGTVWATITATCLWAARRSVFFFFFCFVRLTHTASIATFFLASQLRGVHVHASTSKRFLAPCVWKSASTTLTSLTTKLGARKPNDPRLVFK